jgi:hypothetical protein
MTVAALAKLQHRSEYLAGKLAFGTRTEVAAARELLRHSLIELYELGYWQAAPDEMRKYMRLYRTCSSEQLIALQSMSVPDKRDQRSP